MKFEGKLSKEKGEKYWGISFPEIGVFTQGKTKKEAYEMIKEAIELIVDFDDDFKVDVEPIDSISFFIIPNHVGPILALILKQKRIEMGLTIKDVTMRLGQTSPNAYGRYENGKNIPTLKKFDELLTAINPNTSSILKIS